MTKVTRFRDVLKDSVLYSRLDYIIDDAKNEWLRNLGKNDFIHSQNIEKILDLLVPEHIKRNGEIFDPGEIFLLLTSVYLHDIGRKTLMLHHELESYAQIKKFPSQFHLKDKFEAEAVAQICAAHASEDEWSIEKCDPNYGISGLSVTGRPFNLQRLGSLLRIADEIDNSYVRVQGIPTETDSPRRLIRFINPIFEKGLIEIQADPETWEDWEDLTRIKEYCQRRLREVEKYLEAAGIFYYQVWLRPEKFCTPFKVPKHTSNLDDLVEIIASLAAESYSEVEIMKEIEEFEISILCTDRKFGTATRTAILVYKNLESREAKNARAALSHLMQSNIINAWIVVTVDETIPEISEIISKAGCNVLTLDKLLRQLHDYETPLKRHVSLYENQSIFLEDLFINLKATKETGESIDNIVHYIENWIHTGEGAQLTLLGDFGSGKTTISDRLMHNCAIKYIEGETDRIPILLRLRDLGAGNTIEASITNILVNQYKLDINFNVFNSLNKMGKFLLILDGFDEIPFTITETAILRAFREIDKLVEENSKVILTCRTHFFKDNSMIHELYKGTILYDAIAGKLGYELVFLEAFSREQVRDYIERWAKEDSTKFMNTIEEVYNLSDLATRPVLLNMIAKTIPQLDKMAQSTVNAASLYSLYIRFWLERDDWRSELTVPQRKSLAKLLSSFFFLGGLSEIHHTDLPLLTKQISTIHKNINVDIIEYELRTCNFLRRDHNGTYRFVHKSFMEYLLAQNIVDEMFNNNHDLSLRWLLPVETKSPPKGMIFGTTEMESFFFQIIESKLLDINPEDLYEITKNRKRTHNLTANTIYKLKLLGFGSFFAKSLIDQIVPIDVNMAAHCLTLSNDFDKQFEWIVSTITTNRSRSIDPDKLAIAYDCLVDALRTKEQKYIDALTDAIKTYELSMDNTECGSNDGITTKGYPYLRSEKRKALEIILKDLVDPAEIIKARKEFYRNWEKDKAIYNQKQEIEIKQEKLTFKESFSKDLKK